MYLLAPFQQRNYISFAPTSLLLVENKYVQFVWQWKLSASQLRPEIEDLKD